MKRDLIVIAFVSVVVDQLVKNILNYFLYVNQSISVIPGFFSITYVQNDGAAWSLFSGNLLFLIVITIIAIFALYFFFVKDKILNPIEVVSYGLLFGGIFGNFIDRILRGYVIDFLEFTFWNYHFPVFNIADICIVIGVLLIIISIWKGDEPNATYKGKKRCKEN